MIRSTCVYLIRDGSWLMLLRNRKKDDVNQGKWIGVGGKCEPGETYAQCAEREVMEETGLSVKTLVPEGMLLFEYEAKQPEEIAVYSCRDFTGELKECDEGTLAWIKEEEVLDLSLWEGDRIFLEKMLAGHREPFYLRLVYDKEDRLLESQYCEGEHIL